MKRKIKVKFVDGPRIDIGQLREYNGADADLHGKEVQYDNNYYVNLLREDYDVEFSENPDYLFYSVYSNEFLKYKDCIRIFYTGEMISPDFNLCDYAIGYDYIDYGDRYFRFPLVNIYYPYGTLNNRKIITKEDLADKKRFCDFIYSNNGAVAERIKLFEMVSSYKHVAAGGACCNNIGYRVGDKIKFQSESKFSIACENALFDGYTTEKIGDPFLAGSIPIYYGNKRIQEQFNEKAFINFHKYKTASDFLHVIQCIDENDELYLDMVNQPVYNPDYSLADEENKLKAFLYHIIEQPVADALRRNTGYWGNLYEKKMMESKNKFRMYYNSCLRWMKAKNNGNSAAGYLLEHNCRNIAIYGMGEIGKLLFQELRNVKDISVKALIDKAELNAYEDDVVCIKAEDQMLMQKINDLDIDGIIITAIFNYNEIFERYFKNSDCQIYNFEKILDDITNERA